LAQFFGVLDDTTEAGNTAGSCPDSKADTLPDTCADECIDYIAHVKTELGCCASYIGQYLALDAATNPGAVAFFETECQLGTVDDGSLEACPDPFLYGEFTILNFAWSFYDDNQELVSATLVNDISLAAGVATSAITITAVNEVSGGGISVEYSVMATSNADGDQIAVKLEVDLAFPVLNSAEDVPLAESREEFTQALTADPTTSTLSFTHVTYTIPVDDETVDDEAESSTGPDPTNEDDEEPSSATTLTFGLVFLLPALLTFFNF
jgi:hypothetical protein